MPLVLSRMSVRLTCAFLVAVLAVAAAAGAQTRIRVEFTAAGECAVTTRGPGGHANVRYPRRTAEMKCVVPTTLKPGAVDLEVVLPPGAPRPAGEFPRLDWAESDGRWVGTASLPAPPAFVRIPDPVTGGRLAHWLDLLVLAGAGIGAVWAVARGRAS
jgi:hypothetical protein